MGSSLSFPVASSRTFAGPRLISSGPSSQMRCAPIRLASIMALLGLGGLLCSRPCAREGRFLCIFIDTNWQNGKCECHCSRLPSWGLCLQRLLDRSPCVWVNECLFTFYHQRQHKLHKYRSHCSSLLAWCPSLLALRGLLCSSLCAWVGRFFVHFFDENEQKWNLNLKWHLLQLFKWL